MSNVAPTSDRHVWVVETLRHIPRVWCAFDVRVRRADAWALAREDRKRWPREKFRVVRYVSAKS